MKTQSKEIGSQIAFPFLIWMCVNAGSELAFSLLTTALEALGNNPHTRLSMWYALLGAVTLANLLLSLLDTGWWRPVFFISGVVGLISGIVAGTLGMGFIFYEPYILIEVLQISIEVISLYLRETFA